MQFSRGIHGLEGLEGKSFLITGGQGNLGSAFAEAIRENIPHSLICNPGKAELDVSDVNSFASLNGFSPDFVIHCAAKVDADFCENNPEVARQIVVNGSKNVIDFSFAKGAKLFYPQSFLIFDGSENPTNEVTPPNPLSVYGEMKLEAEDLITSVDDSLIVRMGGFYGSESKDKNFVGKIFEQFKQMLKSGGGDIEIGNREWQPTYTKDLAENSLVLLGLEKSGIFNMACLGKASFYEIALLMTEKLEIDDLVNILPAPDKSDVKHDVAPRPRTVFMDNSRLNLEGLNTQREWKVALSEYLELPFFSAIKNHKTQ
jgi:dTDP-4-dehydrorhamnose reductase